MTITNYNNYVTNRERIQNSINSQMLEVLPAGIVNSAATQPIEASDVDGNAIDAAIPGDGTNVLLTLDYDSSTTTVTTAAQITVLGNDRDDASGEWSIVGVITLTPVPGSDLDIGDSTLRTSCVKSGETRALDCMGSSLLRFVVTQALSTDGNDALASVKMRMI